MKNFFRARAHLFFGAAFLFWIAACADSPSDIIKKKQAEFNTALNNLNAIAARVADQKPGSDTITLPPNAPVLNLNDIGDYAYEGASNAQPFTVQDLLDPEGKSPGMHLFQSRRTLQAVKAMVKDGNPPKSKEEALKALQNFSNWRYAAVIKARSVQAPTIATQPVSTNVTDSAVFSSGSFTAGLIEGDVLLYDLADSRFLGGFPFTAQSSNNVESTSYGGGNSSERLQAQLDRDFTEQIKKAVLYGLLDRLPADRVYMNGNLRQSVMTERGKK